MPGGRPTKYSGKLAREICTRLSGGESLRTICRNEAMPHQATIMRWVGDKEDFRLEYTRAREAQAECLADEIIDLADQADKETVQAIKVRVDARKWVASRLLPKKYGEVRQHQVSGEVTLTLEDVAKRLEERGQDG